ncbi:hypothetical protein [Saccharothrix hoggarensis]|uniref:Uncharacterized protein n=1 Tax=Saccharothrix hoggarensis TaxID=913853 RepID=A0ABW3QTY0_9PSEU
MSEADLREGLRAAVGDEPPLDFDPDELIRRAEHLRRRRRALVAVGVATLALTGTVLSLPGVLDRRPAGIDAAEAPVLTTAVSPPPAAVPPPQTVAPQTVAPRTTVTTPVITDASTRYLTDYLTKRFPDVVPGVKVVGVDFTDTHKQARAGYLTGLVRFVDGAGSSAVAVQLSVPPARVTRDQFCATVVCDEPRREADGSHLEFATSTDPESKMTTHTVAHFRADGSVVQVSGYNHDPTRVGAPRAEVALAPEQMARLATDPGITLR